MIERVARLRSRNVGPEDVHAVVHWLDREDHVATIEELGVVGRWELFIPQHKVTNGIDISIDRCLELFDEIDRSKVYGNANFGALFVSPESIRRDDQEYRREKSSHRCSK